MEEKVERCSTYISHYKFDDFSMESSIWCEVELSDSENLLVGLVYRSPNSTSENNEALRKQLLHTATLNHMNNMLVFGISTSGKLTGSTILYLQG